MLSTVKLLTLCCSVQFTSLAPDWSFSFLKYLRFFRTRGKNPPVRSWNRTWDMMIHDFYWKLFGNHLLEMKSVFLFVKSLFGSFHWSNRRNGNKPVPSDRVVGKRLKLWFKTGSSLRCLLHVNSLSCLDQSTKNLDLRYIEMLRVRRLSMQNIHKIQQSIRNSELYRITICSNKALGIWASSWLTEHNNKVFIKRKTDIKRDQMSMCVRFTGFIKS